MKKILKYSILTLSLLMFTSCAFTVPVSGAGEIKSTKVGRARQTTFIFFKFGDAPTIENAAKNGNISNVTTVHYKTQWFPYTYVECIVRGN